jgi:hypothetical protein
MSRKKPLVLSLCAPLAFMGAVGSAVGGPLGNDFSKNTPSAISIHFNLHRNFLVQRIGAGNVTDWIAQYTRLPNSAPHSAWSMAAFPSATVASTARPAASWFPDKFSALYRRDTTPSLPVRIMDSLPSRGPDVFPTFVCPTAPGIPCTYGPPTTLVQAAFEFNDAGAFAKMGDGTLRQSYAPSGPWGDFPVSPVGPFSVNAGPLLINRSHFGQAGATTSTDSAWYACGPFSPARACEMRRAGGSAPMYFTATFGGATSTFIDGTRPTAISNYSNSGERWVFAATTEPAGRTIWALKENGSIDATTQQTYSIYNVDSTVMAAFQGTYSTPMPYVRHDGKVAIVYFRTTATNTEVWQAVWSGTNWSTSKIHDVGVPIPAGNEPSAFTTTGPSGFQEQTDSVFFRLQSATSQVLDTVELVQQPDGKYARTLLPPAFDRSNLYVIQGATLREVDEAATNTRPALGTVDWTNAGPFVSDGVSLGYTVQNDTLWEVNLNDGSRRQLGTGWANITQLTFGWAAPNREVPRLWAIRSGNLYTVSLADGTTTQLGAAGVWANAQAMAFMKNADPAGDLVIVNGDQALYRVDSVTGARVRQGALGAWQHTRGIETTRDGFIFIADGSDESHMRVYQVDSTGAPIKWTSQFSNVQGMTTISDTVYVMKSRVIYRVSVGASSLALASTGGSVLWDYAVTGMVGRDQLLQQTL